MANFTKATDFEIGSVKVEGEEIKAIFISLEVFEHVYSSGITAQLLVQETASNQVLSDLKIQGNEKVEIKIDTPDEESFIWTCFINKISNRVVTSSGQVTYTIDLVSAAIRNNEQKFIHKRFNKEKPSKIVDYAINQLNKDSKVEIKKDIILGDGLPMNFGASKWRPVRIVNYVQKHGVPAKKGGKTNASGNSQDAIASGAGGYVFTETYRGYRFGSMVEFIDGELSRNEKKEIRYNLEKNRLTMEDKKAAILTFNVLQNNDTQTQQRSGSYKSNLISFDLDSGEYIEQLWESEVATDKQKETSLTPTRTYNRFFSPEKYTNTCDTTGPKGDQSRQSLQQSQGSFNNFSDNVVQFTLPIRLDLSVGDKIESKIFMTSFDSSVKLDEKYSGSYIISAIGHSFSILNKGAHSRITCIRPTNIQSDADSGAKFSSKIKY